MVIVFEIYVNEKRIITFGTKCDAEKYVTVAKAVFSFDDSEIKIRRRAVA